MTKKKKVTSLCCSSSMEEERKEGKDVAENERLLHERSRSKLYVIITRGRSKEMYSYDCIFIFLFLKYLIYDTICLHYFIVIHRIIID